MGKTLADGRKGGSGRPKGSLNPPSKKERPKVKIKSIKLDNNTPYGQQLKPYRQFFKYTYKEFGEISGLDHTNLAHFEGGTAGYKTTVSALPAALTKYLKALGVKEVIIKL